jgi:hypothetical protein|tara:strand:+ start:900 stop:1490 length:591 start_codon:yes stop_codon:yes gene_type:complete
MQSLQPRLILVEILGVIQLLDMMLFILLHFQLLVVQLPGLVLLSFDVLFLVIIPLPDVCEVSKFQLLLLFKFLPIWTINLILVPVLLLPLILFDSSLFLLLKFVILPNSTQTLVIICHPINASFLVSDRILELDGLLQLLIHHAPLPVLPFSLRFQVLIIIIQISLHNEFINIALFTLDSVLLLIVVSNYILKVVI